MYTPDANEVAKRHADRTSGAVAPDVTLRPLGRLIVIRELGVEDEFQVSESCSIEPYAPGVLLARSEDNETRWLINLSKFEAVEFHEHVRVEDAGQ